MDIEFTNSSESGVPSSGGNPYAFPVAPIPPSTSDKVKKIILILMLAISSMTFATEQNTKDCGDFVLFNVVMKIKIQQTFQDT
jgi:hypothetical protein